jgi:nickel-dependent lactate racemase
MGLNQTVRVRSGAWHGDKERSLSFPAKWDICVCPPKEAPALTDEQIQSVLDAPVGTPPLEQLARGKGSAAIVVDDLCRPTPVAAVLPQLLDRLSSAGLPKSAIRFVIGSGSHRPLSREEIATKLGPDVVSSYEVQNHDFMSGELRALGNLSCGMPLYINPTVADADLKICIGGIYPHGLAGFSGGAKLIVPGVAGYTTIHYLHNMCSYRGRGSRTKIDAAEDGRTAMEEAARTLGLDFIVNVVINQRREAAGIVAGDLQGAHARGMELARDIYTTELPNDPIDLVVANAYPYDADPVQLGKSLWVSEYFSNCFVLVVNAACDGICYHGAREGLDYAHFRALERVSEAGSVEARIGDRSQRIVCSEHFPAHDFYKRFAGDILVRDWDRVVSLLGRELRPEAKVVVLPCAPIQLPAANVETLGARRVG